MPSVSYLGRLVAPLRSRKVRVALATAIGALIAEFGLHASSELTLALVGIGSSLILGIAHEDAGRHVASLPKQSAVTATATESIQKVSL